MQVTDIPSRFDRILPLAGPAFTVLMVAAATGFPMPPGSDVSPAGKPGWLVTHHNAVITQTYLRALAALAFIALSVAAAAACRRALPERSALPGLALIGGAFSGGLLLMAQAVGLAAALYVHADGAAASTRALGTVQDGLLDMSSLPAILLFAAVGITALRTGFLPRWFTAITLFGVPFALLDAVSYDGGPFEPVGLVGLVYFLAWALLAGVRLYLTASGLAGRPRHPVVTFVPD
jgi:hypothetical protein